MTVASLFEGGNNYGGTGSVGDGLSGNNNLAIILTTTLTVGIVGTAAILTTAAAVSFLAYKYTSTSCRTRKRKLRTEEEL